MQLCDGFLVVLESGASSGLLLQMLRSILTSHLQCHAILIMKSISGFFNHQICMWFFFCSDFQLTRYGVVSEVLQLVNDSHTLCRECCPQRKVCMNFKNPIRTCIYS